MRTDRYKDEPVKKTVSSFYGDFAALSSFDGDFFRSLGQPPRSCDEIRLMNCWTPPDTSIT